jgi:hypothetical protein
MRKTGGDVDEFVAAVRPAKRQRDAVAMIRLLREIVAEDYRRLLAGETGEMTYTVTD